MSRLSIFVFAALCLFAAHAQAAAPSMITVQGKLTDAGGSPLSPGAKSFTFRIFDALTGGAQVWPLPGPGGEPQTITTGADGLWIGLVGAVSPLNDVVFSDTVRWLEITVAGTTLPRTHLVTGPYAYRVATVDGASGGTITSKVSIGPGHTNTGTNAFVAGQGNSAANSYVTISGGLNHTAAGFCSVIGGGQGNVASGQNGTVAGGQDNTASGQDGTVGGGQDNASQESYSTVAGGQSNTAASEYSAVGGGFGNIAGGNASFVGGGRRNVADGDSSTIAGGVGNTTIGINSTIGGGADNISGVPPVAKTALGEITVAGTTVGGGLSNQAIGAKATVSGGESNQATGPRATVGGGQSNQATSDNATVAGGANNIASGFTSSIGGGFNNVASGGMSSIGGGSDNNASGERTTVAGGAANAASGQDAAVGGGNSNTAAGGFSTVAGGFANIARGEGATVSGGSITQIADTNYAQGTCATVPGGRRNGAVGDFSFAAGYNAHANHRGSIVIAANGSNTASDSIRSGAPDQIVLRADSGLFITNASGIATFTAGQLISTTAGAPGAHLTTSGVWTNASNAANKENFSELDREDLLDKVAALPITQWNYKVDPDNVTHIGPTAQDFYRLFHVGGDDKTISTIDPSGVALAAIQELDRRTRKIEQLEVEINRLTAIVQDLVSARK